MKVVYASPKGALRSFWEKIRKPLTLKEKAGAFILFLIIVLRFIAGSIQGINLFKSTQGLDVSIFISQIVFTGGSSYLLFRSFMKKGDRLMVSMMLMHSFVFLATIAGLAVFINDRVSHDMAVGDSVDAAIGCFVVAGILCVAIWCTGREKTFWHDPVAQGVAIAIIVGIPQFGIAREIWMHGNMGYKTEAIFLAHIAVVLRMILLVAFAPRGKENGDTVTVLWRFKVDRARKGEFIAEFCNWVAWIVVTLSYAYTTAND